MVIRHEIETAAREAFGGEPEPVEARPFSFRLIWSLVAIEIAAIGAFVWVLA